MTLSATATANISATPSSLGPVDLSLLTILPDANGTIAVPEAPGLGIVLDEEQLKRYGEKFFEITSRGIAVKTIREKGLFTALKLARRKKRP